MGNTGYSFRAKVWKVPGFYGVPSTVFQEKRDRCLNRSEAEVGMAESGGCFAVEFFADRRVGD